MGAVVQLLLDHLLLIGLGPERLGHIVMKYPHARLMHTIEAGLAHPLPNLAGVQGLLWGEAALAFTGQLIALQLAELALDEVLVDQCIAVIERQRHRAPGADQLPQVDQGRGGIRQPFQHRMTDDQIVLAGMGRQFLQWQGQVAQGLAGPERYLIQPAARRCQHLARRLAHRQVVAPVQQPFADMAETGTHIQHSQRRVLTPDLRDPHLQIAGEHGKADGALRAGVDLAGEVAAQLIEVAVGHGLLSGFSGSRVYQSDPVDIFVTAHAGKVELNKSGSVGSYSGKNKEEIPMRLRTTLIQASAVGMILSPLAMAAEQPISNLGLIGAYNDYELNSDNDRVDGRDEDVGKVGVYYNFGNKMTGGPGVIFQIGANARYGEHGDDEVKDARADLDLGMRMPLNNNTNFDVLVGAGYDWTRFEMDDRRAGDVELSNKSPFAKAALGLHHRGNNVITRLEVGTRYSIEGEAKVKLDGVGSETVDLEDKFNPYAELNFLWDNGFTAGVYYTQTNYELDDRRELAANTELESNEVGVTLGMAF